MLVLTARAKVLTSEANPVPPRVMPQNEWQR